MNKRLFTISLLVMAAISMTAKTDTDSLLRYQVRQERYRRQWAALIPSQLVIQNAGNMGIVSVGTGWSYGRRRQWETQFLVGYIPKYESTRGKVTFTLKENFLPWSMPVGNRWDFQPLSASLYLNTVYGHEFWRSQPNRYPDKYYDFMSTKFRWNIALGERITYNIPQHRRKFVKSISAFYEFSTCDLYIRAKVQDSEVKLSDIVGLSLGVKMQIF